MSAEHFCHIALGLAYVFLGATHIRKFKLPSFAPILIHFVVAMIYLALAFAPFPPPAADTMDQPHQNIVYAGAELSQLAEYEKLSS